MRVLIRIVKWVLLAGAVVVIGLLGWLYWAPPELIQVGSAYSAKVVCSNVFLAGRDAEQVLNDDVQAPGHPLLRIMRVSVDREAKTVTAGLLGIFGKSVATAREGLGCTSVPDGDIASARRISIPVEPVAPAPDALWPEGNRVEALPMPALNKVLGDVALTGPGMRSVVVVHDGRIVGERYADGFSSKTPLLGWSMTKTVNAAIIGTLVAAGKLAVDRSNLLPEWAGDDRKSIGLDDLMGMSSGLGFNEEYGDVTDVTRMLFLIPDMASFAASQPLVAGIGQTWNYSSGTALILSRIWQSAAGADALMWPRRALFGPLGMTSATLEADEKGTFAGSSYLYATARDWARFGQFMLQDGTWEGKRILPPGFVAWMREAAPASKGSYGKGQLWLRGPGASGPQPEPGLPADIYWMIGHDGQTIAVVPSKKLVVVRLGLTPGKLGYKPQPMLQALCAIF